VYAAAATLRSVCIEVWGRGEGGSNERGGRLGGERGERGGGGGMALMHA
jgi:hypothetical protein